MSKLLINEPPLLVPIELVMRIGLKQSVILQGLIDISERESINFDGENWFRCNMDDLYKNHLNFVGIGVFRRAIEALKKIGFVYTSNQFNETLLDATNWWYIDFDAINSILILPENPNIRKTYVKKKIPNRIRQHIFERDGKICLHCGASERLSVDHIKPESKGGTMNFSNLQTLCVSCNSKKGSKWQL